MQPATDSTQAIPYHALVTKIGFGGHNFGSRLVATLLKDAGMKVVYTPAWESIETVVKLAPKNISVLARRPLITSPCQT